MDKERLENLLKLEAEIDLWWDSLEVVKERTPDVLATHILYYMQKAIIGKELKEFGINRKREFGWMGGSPISFGLVDTGVKSEKNS